MSEDKSVSRKSDRITEGRRQERAALRAMGLKASGDDEVPRMDLQPAFHPETPAEYKKRLEKHRLHIPSNLDL